MKRILISLLLAAGFKIPAFAQVSATDSMMQAGMKLYMEGRHAESVQALLAAKADSGSTSTRLPRQLLQLSIIFLLLADISVKRSAEVSHRHANETMEKEVDGPFSL